MLEDIFDADYVIISSASGLESYTYFVLFAAIAMTPWRQSYIEEVYALPSPFIEDARILSVTCLDPSFVDVDHQTVCVHLHWISHYSDDISI